MATKKEYEMLFALEAQLGREFRATFAQARDELGDTAESAETFGSRTTQAVDAVSGALAAIGAASALREFREAFDECTQASMDFESAITGVAKTTDLTDEELADMSDAIMDMSTRIPATTEEISAVAEAAGQLGIQKDALLSFTETMTMLGTATNMTAEDAATALARFANITGMSADNYDRLGAVIVDLGNNFATAESEITQMGTRLASGGKLAGLTEPQIMALAAAMSSVGIEAEAGGTAMTQTLNAIEKAVANGEESLWSFADVAGMSADEFAQKWDTDALSALTAFIRGLGKLDEQGESTVLVLEDLGLTGIRQSNMLKSLALAADKMDSAVQTANTAWDENTALLAEASKRYATTQSKMDMAQNAVNNLETAIGDVFTPTLGNLYDLEIDVLKDAAEFVKQNPSLVKALAATATAIGGITAALAAYNAVKKVVKVLDLGAAFGGAGPLMLGVAAVGLLTGGIVGLADAAKDRAAPSVKELTEAARDLNSAIADAKSGYDDTIGQAMATATVAEQYIGRLKELDSVSEKTAAQQQEYHGLLVKLTETIPELADCIDLENDVIDGGTASLEANTDAWIENARAQAYQNELSEIYAKYAGTEMERAKRQAELTAAKEAAHEATVAYNAALAKQSALYDEAQEKAEAYYEETGILYDAEHFLGSEIDSVNDEVTDANIAWVEALRTVTNLEESINVCNETLAEADGEIQAVRDAHDSLTGAMENGTGAAGDAARGQEELSAAFGSTKEQIDTITQAYQEAFEAARSSVESQYSLWSNVDQIVETTAGTINDNLTKQIDHWQSYNDSLAKLRERSDDIDGLADIIGSFADGSAESVNAVAGMASASDEDLKEMVENWQTLKKSQQEAEESIAEYRSSFGEQMDALQSDLEDDIAAMDLGPEAMASGQATIQGFLDGATGMLPMVESAYNQIGRAALRALYGNRRVGHRGASVYPGMVDQAYADGTTSAEAGLALVGEEGPELVMMQGGETVLNTHATEVALGGSSGTEINSPLVEINIEGNADQNVIDQLNLYSEELANRVISIIQDLQADRKRTIYA